MFEILFLEFGRKQFVYLLENLLKIPGFLTVTDQLAYFLPFLTKFLES